MGQYHKDLECQINTIETLESPRLMPETMFVASLILIKSNEIAKATEILQKL